MSKEVVNRTFFLDSCPEWSLGLLGFLAEQRSIVRKLWSSEARQQVTSGHKNWDNTNYCRRLSSEAEYQYTLPDFLDMLEPNFETFTDEYCLGSPIKTYQFSLLENEAGEVVGTTGVDNAYKEDGATQAQRFQDEKLAKLGKRQQRAAIETFNCQRLDTWISQVFRMPNIPVGTKLTWFSPPGHLIEGYHGVSPKHHSFIWVYEKKDDGDHSYVEMTQFRCWPSLKQIQRIQENFGQHAVNSGALPPFPENPQLTQRNLVISNMIELPASVSIDQIENMIYTNEKKWPVKRTDMPEFKLNDEAKKAFIVERDRVLHTFLRPIYESVLGDPSVQALLEKNFDDVFWTSDRYRFMIAQLDVAFALSKQSLDKWVENYVGADTVKEFSAVRIDDLKSLYGLRMKHMTEGLDSEEREAFNTLAPAVLSVGNRLLSVGMCGVGMLIPLNLVGKLGLSSFSSATAVAQIGAAEVGQLSRSEKLQFRADVLEMYAPLEVVGRKGQKHLFWVRKEYFDDYDGHCYEDENGVLRGPCDVPLTMEDDEFILTNEKYQELLAATQKERDDAELKRLTAEEELLLANANSEQERDAIRSHYKHLKGRYKHRISITEFMNNDVLAAPVLRAA